MKKFIAGIVMTSLMFMALASPAFAGKWSGRSTWQQKGGQNYTSCDGDYPSSAGNWYDVYVATGYSYC